MKIGRKEVGKKEAIVAGGLVGVVVAAFNAKRMAHGVKRCMDKVQDTYRSTGIPQSIETIEYQLEIYGDVGPGRELYAPCTGDKTPQYQTTT